MITTAEFPDIETALTSAESRIAAVAARGRQTLIDQIPDDEFAEWDGSGEKALVGVPRVTAG